MEWVDLDGLSFWFFFVEVLVLRRIWSWRFHQENDLEREDLRSLMVSLFFVWSKCWFRVGICFCFRKLSWFPQDAKILLVGSLIKNFTELLWKKPAGIVFFKPMIFASVTKNFKTKAFRLLQCYFLIYINIFLSGPSCLEKFQESVFRIESQNFFKFMKSSLLWYQLLTLIFTKTTRCSLYCQVRLFLHLPLKTLHFWGSYRTFETCQGFKFYNVAWTLILSETQFSYIILLYLVFFMQAFFLSFLIESPNFLEFC